MSLADQTDTPKDKWRATWRNMKLVCDGCNSETIRTGDSGDQKMGEAPIQQKIELRLIRNTAEGASSQTFPIQAPEWGPLWLIHKYKGEREKLDPKTWLVELPLTAPDTSGSLRLKLKFDGVLPELDKWPAL